MTSKTVLLVCLTSIIMASFLTAPVLASIDGTFYLDTISGTQIVKRDSDYTVPQAKCRCSFASAMFSQAVGAVSFHQNPCGQTTFVGQFSNGFDPTHEYSFTIRDNDGHVAVDLTPYFKIKILDNGSVAPFTATTRQFSLNCPQATNPQDLQGYDPESSGGGYQFGQSGYGGGYGSDAAGTTQVGGNNAAPAVMGLGLFIGDNTGGGFLDNAYISPTSTNSR